MNLKNSNFNLHVENDYEEQNGMLYTHSEANYEGKVSL